MPESFSHPLLATEKTAPPQAAVAPASAAPPAAKSDRADLRPGTTSDSTSVGLRATIGQSATMMALPPAANNNLARPDHGDGMRSASADVIPLLAGDVAEVTLTSDPPQPASPPGEKIKADPNTADNGADGKKDQTRLSDPDQAAAKPQAAPMIPLNPKQQIAVLISRKDSKLYVRQNFAPLFDVPVTIAPSDRPLGTHVFTAQLDTGDANRLHWSVVSLPQAPPAERRDGDGHASHRRKTAGVAESKPQPMPDSPAEALDRLTLPADTMAQITAALSTGGSIIVTDQGINAGETGEGTDFIVSLR
jgi:hypothetical protein